MDLTQVESVIGLATAAMGMTGQAATTAETIKRLFSSEKAPNAEESSRLLNSLATQLTAANITNVQLSEALKALSQELKHEDDFEKEKSRYELVKTNEGDMVFRLKADQSNGQPAHFICPVCLNTNKLISFITGERDFKVCQTNKGHLYRFHSSPPSRTRSNDWLA